MLNPFLYCLLSKRFRRGFHDLKERISGWWAANISSHQSSSTPESSYRANFIARPFMSLPNPQDSSDFRIRESAKNALVWNTEVPRATIIHLATGVQRCGTPQLAVEMRSIANDNQDESNSEIAPSYNSLQPYSYSSKQIDENRLRNYKTNKFLSQTNIVDINLHSKTGPLIKTSSFNPNTCFSINDTILLSNNKATINHCTCLLDLRTIKRTRSLIYF